MAGVDDLFNQYLGADYRTAQKQSEVSQAATAKKAEVGQRSTTIKEDLNSRTGLNPLQLGLKYGSPADALIRGRVYDDTTPDVPNAERTTGEVVSDSVIGAGSAFANSLLGIGSLALGASDKATGLDLGVRSAKTIQDFNEATQFFQSDTLNAKRVEAARKSAPAYERSQKKFEEDAKKEGSFVAGLKRLGRDTLTALDSSTDDTALAGDVTAQGIGSLFGVGPVSKALSGTGKFATPLAIGATEAGGTYTQTVQDALDRGASSEKANSAALLAAAVQAPTSVLAGKLVDKFEANPLKIQGANKALRTIGKETLEEAIQNTTGQVSQNLGIKGYVDPNTNLTDDVAEQAVQGALGGALSTGAVTAPGATLKASVDAAKLGARTTMRGVRAGIQGTKDVGNIYGGVTAGIVKPAVDVAKNALSPIYQKIVERGDRIIAEQAKASPVAEDKIRSNLDVLDEQAPEMESALKSAIEEVKASPEIKDEGNAYVDSLFQATKFDEATLDNPGVPDRIRASLSGSKDKFEAVQRLAELVNKSADNQQDHLSSAIMLSNMINEFEDVINRDPGILDTLGADHPANQMLDNYSAIIGNIVNTPKVIRALRDIQSMSMEVAPVRDDQIGTPQGDQLIENAIGAATIAPDRANPEATQKILLMADKGDVTLTPAQRTALQSSLVIFNAQTKANELADRNGAKPEDIVNRQIIYDDKDGTDRREKSAFQHAQGIVSAYRSGNEEVAAARLSRFMKFAQHMQNKVAALNTHFASRESNPKSGVRYKALTPNGAWLDSVKGISVHPQNAGSVRFAQRVNNEAQTVAEIANNLASIFPSLNVDHVEPVSLDAALLGKADEIAKKFAKERQDSNKQEKDIVPSDTTEPNPEKDVVADPKPESKSEDSTLVVDKSEPNSSDSPVEATEAKSEEPKVSEPETEANLDQAPTEVTRKGLDLLYPDLVGSEGTETTNLFKKYFKLPAEAKSRLTGIDSPLITMVSVLKNAGTLAKEIGESSAKGFNADIAEAYKSYLRQAYKLTGKLNTRLEAYLASPESKDSKRTKLDRMLSDPKFIGYRNNKVLNFIQKVNGKYQYNPEIIESASLAAMQWLISSDAQNTPLREEDLLRVTGYDNLDDIPKETRDNLNAGLTLVQAKETLALKIEQYLGLKSAKDTPEGISKGLMQGLASEMIAALNERGLVKLDLNKIADGKEIYTIIPERLGDNNPIKLFPDVIERAVLVNPEPVHYIGEVPTEVAETQLRNSSVKLTANQKQALKNEQQVPHYINSPMVAFLGNLGVDNLVELFGAGKLDPDKFNRTHYESLDSKNRSIISAYETLKDIQLQAEHKAELAGVDLDQVPIHYRYNFTRVNRMQMLGKNSPQASKLMREAILPTRSTLDMTDSDNLSRFYLAIGQAIGEKVHTQTRQTTEDKVTQALAGDLASLVQSFRDWLPNQGEISSEMLDQLKAAKLSNVGVHAVMEYARFLNQKDKSSFTTSLYVEADGVTNGPVNAMAMFTPGYFTLDQIKNIAKGGMFIGANGKTMNEHRSSDDEVDLYQATTDVLKEKFQQLRESGSSEQLEAMIMVMNEFMPDVNFDDPDKPFGRGVTKNPLTITIYGSGEQGIAGNLVDTMASAIYERMSEALQRSGSNQSIGMLMFGGPEDIADQKFAKISKAIELLTGNSINSGFDLQTFKFTNEQKDNFARSVKDLFVVPMREAIQQTVGPDTLRVVDNMRAAMQVQSIFYQYAFIKQVKEAVAAKKAADPTWNNSNFLTPSELNEIRDKLSHLAPTISTANQNYMITGRAKSDFLGVDNSYAATLGDGLRTAPNVDTPGNARVAAIPFLTIGYGDGMTMQDMSLVEKINKTLKVFDGVHLSLDQLEDGSQVANEAVWKSWMTNPLQDVANRFEEFMNVVTFKDTDEAIVKDLVRAVLDPTRKDGTPKEIGARMLEIMNDLKADALAIQARHNALARVNISVDQMAAIGTPYQQTGDVDLTNLTPDQIHIEMNRLYEEEYNKLDTSKKSEDIKSDISNVGRLDKTGARVLSFTAVRNMFKGINIPNEQKAVLGDILKSMSTKGWTVVYGSEAELQAYAEKYNKTIPASPDKVGATVIGERTMYLYEPSSETLVHELIHAATFEKVQAHYEGETTPEITGAIERMEALMNQFLGIELVEVNASLRGNYNTAQAAIQNYLLSNQKAEALNEFMAYGLSNSDLIRLEKRTEATTLGKIIASVRDALKKLIFGRKQIAKAGEDIFSNLRFNTNIILRAQPTLYQMVTETTLYQNKVFGDSDRLVQIQKAFNNVIVAKFGSNNLNNVIRGSIVGSAITKAISVTRSMASHGFKMTPQEYTLHEMIVATLATEAEVDPNALVRAQELYAHVIENISVESFMKDPNSTDPADRFYAQEKYDALLGNYIREIDDSNRSTLLPSFLALAITNEEFRNILKTIPVPKTEKGTWDTVDNILHNFGNSLMDSMSARMGGTAGTKNIKDAIDALSAEIVRVANDRKSYIEQFTNGANNAVNGVNDFLVKQIGYLSDKGLEKFKSIEDNSNSKIIKTAATYGQFISGIVSEKNGKEVANSLMTWLNKSKATPEFIRDVITDLVGRTDSNKEIYDDIKTVKSQVSQDRQQFREHLPSIIADKFSRKLTDDEWAAQHKVIGKTDLVSLVQSFSNEEIIQMLQDPDIVDTHINNLEAKLQESYSKDWPRIQKKAKQLARYMNTGIVGNNLLRNSMAVSNLWNEGGTTVNVTEAMITQVDQLVSLYALNTVDGFIAKQVVDIAKSEPEAMDFVLSYMKGQRAEELRKQTPVSRANGYKGYIPAENQSGVSMVVAGDKDFQDLVQRSWVRVAEYKGSNLERGTDAKSYYFSPVSAKAPYNQGIIQNVRSTSNGVDLATGFTHGAMTAGRIYDPETVQRLNKRIRAEGNIGEPLMPIFDSKGNVTAFERSIDPNQLQRLNPDLHLAKNIGIWRGRQMEEIKAQIVNEALVDKLYNMYQESLKDSSERQKEYVDLFDKSLIEKMPILKDGLNLITPETRSYIKSVFGDNFYVRRDMLNDTFGYRNASVGDAWTGNSRWSPTVQKEFQRLATGIFGAQAYQRFVNAEKLLQNFISDARVTIVIKSVIVPIGNLISNMYQLTAVGVPFVSIVRGMPKKTAELELYTKTRLEKIALEAELRASESDPQATIKYKRRIQAINDSWKRLSIYPLLQSGEFTAISDAGISRDEILLTEGKLQEYIERLTDKLPGPLRTAGRYALITKDTALFQGLQKAVEYGDFLAKAILYDDLVKRQGKTKEQALGRVTEEFVNYDRLPGRDRGYLESVGLMWFYNFKIRSAKVAVSIIRNNPLQAFLVGLAPAPTMFGNIGLPTHDNIFAKIADGSIDNSLGYGQGIRSFFLNPWVNIVK